MKLLAGAILVLFLTQDLLYGASLAAQVPQAMRYKIPPGLGRIDSYHRGTSDKTIIFVQDAHDSIEAQLNIARIIRHAVAKYEVKTVFEEGYEGAVPTDEVYKSLTDPLTREAVSYYLLDHLRIGGAEYAHINREKLVVSRQSSVSSQNKARKAATIPTSAEVLSGAQATHSRLKTEERRHDFKLIGADSFKGHFENVRWFQRTIKQKAPALQDIDLLVGEFQRLADERFPKPVKGYLKLKQRFDDEQMDLVNYLKRARPFVPKEIAYPAIDLLLKADQVNRLEARKQIEGIAVQDLFQEMQQMEFDISAALFKELPKQKKIFFSLQHLSRVKRLLDFKMTPAELNAVKRDMLAFDTKAMARLLVQEMTRSAVFSKTWERAVRDAIQFYEAALKREATAETQLTNFITQSREKNAVLIYGGFHRQGIESLLTRQGVSYYVVSPTIREMDTHHPELYQRLMGQGYAINPLTRRKRNKVSGERQDILAGSMPADLPRAARLISELELVHAGGSTSLDQLGQFHGSLERSARRVLRQSHKRKDPPEYVSARMDQIIKQQASSLDAASRSEVRSSSTDELSLTQMFGDQMPFLKSFFEEGYWIEVPPSSESKTRRILVHHSNPEKFRPLQESPGQYEIKRDEKGIWQLSGIYPGLPYQTGYGRIFIAVSLLMLAGFENFRHRNFEIHAIQSKSLSKSLKEIKSFKVDSIDPQVLHGAYPDVAIGGVIPSMRKEDFELLTSVNEKNKIAQKRSEARRPDEAATAGEVNGGHVEPRETASVPFLPIPAALKELILKKSPRLAQTSDWEKKLGGIRTELSVSDKEMLTFFRAFPLVITYRPEVLKRKWTLLKALAADKENQRRWEGLRTLITLNTEALEMIFKEAQIQKKKIEDPNHLRRLYEQFDTLVRKTHRKTAAKFLNDEKVTRRGYVRPAGEPYEKPPVSQLLPLVQTLVKTIVSRSEVRQGDEPAEPREGLSETSATTADEAEKKQIYLAQIERIRQWIEKIRLGAVPPTLSFGDKHGNPEELEQILGEVKKADQQGTLLHVIGHGDFFDRGTQNKRNYEILREMKQIAAGNPRIRVDFLFGNHETMALRAVLLREAGALGRWKKTGGHTVLKEFAAKKRSGSKKPRFSKELREMEKWIFLNSQLVTYDELGFLHLHAGIPAGQDGSPQVTKMRLDEWQRELEGLKNKIGNDPKKIKDVKWRQALKTFLDKTDVLVTTGANKWLGVIDGEGKEAERLRYAAGIEAQGVVAGHVPQKTLGNWDDRFFLIDTEGGDAGWLIWQDQGLSYDSRFREGVDPIISKENLIAKMEDDIKKLQQLADAEEAVGPPIRSENRTFQNTLRGYWPYPNAQIAQNLLLGALPDLLRQSLFEAETLQRSAMVIPELVTHGAQQMNLTTLHSPKPVQLIGVRAHAEVKPDQIFYVEVLNNLENALDLISSYLGQAYPGRTFDLERGVGAAPAGHQDMLMMTVRSQDGEKAASISPFPSAQKVFSYQPTTAEAAYNKTMGLGQADNGRSFAHRFKSTNSDTWKSARSEVRMDRNSRAEALEIQYTLDPDKAKSLAVLLREAEEIQVDDKRVLIVGDKKLLEMTPLGSTRFFDLNRRWILTLDPFDNPIEQLRWSEENKFESALLWNVDRDVYAMSPLGEKEAHLQVQAGKVHDVHRVGDSRTLWSRGAFVFYEGLDLNDRPGEISGSGGYHFSKGLPSVAGLGYTVLNFVSMLAKDQGQRLTYIGNVPTPWLTHGLKEVGRSEKLNANYRDAWEPYPAERIFNSNGFFVSVRDGRVERAYYDGEMFLPDWIAKRGEHFLLPSRNGSIFVIDQKGTIIETRSEARKPEQNATVNFLAEKGFREKSVHPDFPRNLPWSSAHLLAESGVSKVIEALNQLPFLYTSSWSHSGLPSDHAHDILDDRLGLEERELLDRVQGLLPENQRFTQGTHSAFISYRADYQSARYLKFESSLRELPGVQVIESPVPGPYGLEKLIWISVPEAIVALNQEQAYETYLKMRWGEVLAAIDKVKTSARVQSELRTLSLDAPALRLEDILDITKVRKFFEEGYWIAFEPHGPPGQKPTMVVAKPQHRDPKKLEGEGSFILYNPFGDGPMRLTDVHPRLPSSADTYGRVFIVLALLLQVGHQETERAFDIRASLPKLVDSLSKIKSLRITSKPTVSTFSDIFGVLPKINLDDLKMLEGLNARNHRSEMRAAQVSIRDSALLLARDEYAKIGKPKARDFQFPIADEHGDIVKQVEYVKNSGIAGTLPIVILNFDSHHDFYPGTSDSATWARQLGNRGWTYTVTILPVLDRENLGGFGAKTWVSPRALNQLEDYRTIQETDRLAFMELKNLKIEQHAWVGAKLLKQEFTLQDYPGQVWISMDYDFFSIEPAERYTGHQIPADALKEQFAQFTEYLKENDIRVDEILGYRSHSPSNSYLHPDREDQWLAVMDQQIYELRRHYFYPVGKTQRKALGLEYRWPKSNRSEIRSVPENTLLRLPEDRLTPQDISLILTHLSPAVSFGEGGLSPYDRNLAVKPAAERLMESGLVEPNKIYEYVFPGHSSYLPPSLRRETLLQDPKVPRDQMYQIDALDGRVFVLAGGGFSNTERPQNNTIYESCLFHAFSNLAKYVTNQWQTSEALYEIHLPADVIYSLTSEFWGGDDGWNVRSHPTDGELLRKGFSSLYQPLLQTLQLNYATLGVRGETVTQLGTSTDSPPRLLNYLWDSSDEMTSYLKKRLASRETNKVVRSEMRTNSSDDTSEPVRFERYADVQLEGPESSQLDDLDNSLNFLSIPGERIVDGTSLLKDHGVYPEMLKPGVRFILVENEFDVEELQAIHSDGNNVTQEAVKRYLTIGSFPQEGRLYVGQLGKDLFPWYLLHQAFHDLFFVSLDWDQRKSFLRLVKSVMGKTNSITMSPDLVVRLKSLEELSRLMDRYTQGILLSVKERDDLAKKLIDLSEAFSRIAAHRLGYTYKESKPYDYHSDEFREFFAGLNLKLVGPSEGKRSEVRRQRTVSAELSSKQQVKKRVVSQTRKARDLIRSANPKIENLTMPTAVFLNADDLERSPRRAVTRQMDELMALLSRHKNFDLYVEGDSDKVQNRYFRKLLAQYRSRIHLGPLESKASLQQKKVLVRVSFFESQETNMQTQRALRKLKADYGLTRELTPLEYTRGGALKGFLDLAESLKAEFIRELPVRYAVRTSSGYLRMADSYLTSIWNDLQKNYVFQWSA